MRRDCPVWIESYQAYLIKKCTKEELETINFNQMSDEEISKLYHQYIEEKGIEEEAFRWTMEYCKQWM